MKYCYNDYETSCEYIKKNMKNIGKTAIVIGSGLSFLVDFLEEKQVIYYHDIPNFPKSTVSSHAGQLVTGKLLGKSVIVMNGRFHHYEGHTMEEVTFPIRVLKLLGVHEIILTNAAGGINKNFLVGGVMLITDHIKWMGDSPLRGINEDKFGVRFPDMTRIYSEELLNVARSAAKEQGIALYEGVYGYAFGPQFETPAEVRGFGILGADAVGMSTAPEAIVANHCGLKVLGISCITNMAAGITGNVLNDEEVNEVANRNKEKIGSLVLKIVENI